MSNTVTVAAYNKLAERADRAVTAMKNFKTKTRLSERRMLTSGEALAGGIIGGVIDGKFGEDGNAHEVAGIPTVAAVGVVAVIAGLSEAVPGGEDLLALGSGMLSYAAGNYTKSAITTEE